MPESRVRASVSRALASFGPNVVSRLSIEVLVRERGVCAAQAESSTLRDNKFFVEISLSLSCLERILIANSWDRGAARITHPQAAPIPLRSHYTLRRKRKPPCPHTCPAAGRPALRLGRCRRRRPYEATPLPPSPAASGDELHHHHHHHHHQYRNQYPPRRRVTPFSAAPHRRPAGAAREAAPRSG